MSAIIAHSSAQTHDAGVLLGKGTNVTDEKVTMTAAEETRLDWTAEHRRQYLESDGREGHIVNLAEIGGLSFTTCLLLETVGRKSGKTRIHPLIYGDINGEVIIVASKGGADVDPGWYFNMTAVDEVAFQIGGQGFRATWRELDGVERDEIWTFMVNLYPPYEDYQAGTGRRIPLIALNAIEPIARFKAE
jgi:deazaflavin-dependent oxidoreductase (nitroreductase family)